MELDSGTRLGPYEIVSRLGAGGMGEVWRARDTRLDRNVAIKMLPASLANNAQLRLRFEREAKTISQLQHPHICTLFDVGSDGGHDFLVMELIDGETLAARLSRGPLPLEQVFRYGIQIADALAKAHRHGIVHRDLKPGNVMIANGGVKLLDFGLAKQATSAVIASDATTALATPSQTPLTAEGTILGTLQYMSPEQLEGIEADARTDIFAFGAVLYEMVTGKLAFQASSKTSLIAAIVDREPAPISSVVAEAPPALERVISLCLRKKPDDRWQSIQDVKLELEAIAAGAPVTASTARAAKRAWLGWAAALLIATGAGVASWVHVRSDHSNIEAQRFSFDPPATNHFRVDQQPPVVAPDGKRFLAGVGGNFWGAKLGIRTTTSFDLTMLPNTEDSYDGFWSRDGRQIAFFQNAKLRRMSANGGAIETIASCGDSRSGSWGEGDTIVFSPGKAGPLMAIAATGGAARAVTKLDPARKEIGHWRPFFLPDGKHFLYTAHSADPDLSAVYCGSVDSFDRKKILDRDTIAVYGDGYVLYVDKDDLYAQKFDAKNVEKVGEPVLVAKNVELTRNLGAPGYSAAGGTLMFYQREPVTNASLVRVDRRGGRREVLPNGAGVNLDLSPDQTRLAVRRQDPETRRFNIWSYDLARQASNRLSEGTGNDSGPVWSPDGRYLVYSSTRDGVLVVIRRLASGAGGEEIIYQMSDAEAVKGGVFELEPDTWSSDGRYVVIEVQTGTRGGDLFTIDLLAPNRQLTPFIATASSEHSARFSSDGRWILYTSDESGAPQVYVQPFPATGAKWQVSIDGGRSAQWRGDDGEIYFVGQNDVVFAASVTARGKELDFGKPVAIFEKGSDDYEVAADGNTFFLSVHPAPAALPMYVITNWTHGLDAH